MNRAVAPSSMSAVTDCVAMKGPAAVRRLVFAAVLASVVEVCCARTNVVVGRQARRAAVASPAAPDAVAEASAHHHAA